MNTEQNVDSQPNTADEHTEADAIDTSKATSVPDSERSHALLAPARAKQPLALPAAGFTGPLVALLVLAVGLVGIRDGVVAAGWLDGSSWTGAAAEWIDGLTFDGWMIPVAIVSIIVGLLLLFAALKPRRKTAVALTAETSVYIEPAGIARVAADAARSVPGVLDARASATRRSVTVRADVTGDDRSGLKKAIADQVRSALEPLATAPKTSVRTRTGGRS